MSNRKLEKNTTFQTDNTEKKKKTPKSKKKSKKKRKHQLGHVLVQNFALSMHKAAVPLPNIPEKMGGKYIYILLVKCDKKSIYWQKKCQKSIKNWQKNDKK
jgi:hypothetical protein